MAQHKHHIPAWTWWSWLLSIALGGCAVAAFVLGWPVALGVILGVCALLASTVAIAGFTGTFGVGEIPSNTCIGCDYDLTRLPIVNLRTTCPECGKSVLRK